MHLTIHLPYRHRASLLGRLTVLPRRGRYAGRLAFNPDTEAHTDRHGRRVVTFDSGASWRYAKRGDLSHNARYEKQVVTVDTTANQLAALQIVHGPDMAATLVDPHHYEVQTGDEHYDLSAPNLTRLKADTDEVAPTVTSHTDAYQATA